MRALSITLVLLLLAAGPAHVESSDAALGAALQRQLTQYLVDYGEAEHISTASLCISLHNAPAALSFATGTTSKGGSQPTSPTNLFQIGSNTKAFTAVALLQLEASGRLNLNQTVGHWLPQYKPWKNVTIRQLLNMTSGIPTYDDDVAFLKQYAANPTRFFRATDLVAFVYPKRGQKPEFKRGWYYSNTGYILAQLIIERATGRSYQDQVTRRFLHGNLGLKSTYYDPHIYPQNVLRRTVSGYFANNDPENSALAPILGSDVRNDSLSWAQAAGGIVSTPLDLTRWVRALYHGKLLPPKQQRELLALISVKSGKPIARTSRGDPRGFGLGVSQMTDPTLGTYWFYEGSTLGYRVLYVYFPKPDATIAIGLNSQPPSKQDHIARLATSVYKSLRAAHKL